MTMKMRLMRSEVRSVAEYLVRTFCCDDMSDVRSVAEYLVRTFCCDDMSDVRSEAE